MGKILESTSNSKKDNMNLREIHKEAGALRFFPTAVDRRTAKQIFKDELAQFSIKTDKDITNFLNYMRSHFKIDVRFTK